jgi:hypothetical protein
VSPLPRTGFSEETIQKNGQIAHITKGKVVDRQTASLALDATQGVYVVELAA